MKNSEIFNAHTSRDLVVDDSVNNSRSNAHQNDFQLFDLAVHGDADVVADFKRCGARVFRHGVTIRQVNPRAEEALLYADCHGVPLRNRQRKVSVRILVFLLEVFQPVFWLIRFIFRLVNPVLFSWWLKPLFERWVRNAFAEDPKQAIPALFDLHGGRVVTGPNPRVNDSGMDYLCISSPTLVFKFRRWHRENYEIEVAPTFAPTDSYQLLDVLHVDGVWPNATAPSYFSTICEARIRAV